MNPIAPRFGNMYKLDVYPTKKIAENKHQFVENYFDHVTELAAMQEGEVEDKYSVDVVVPGVKDVYVFTGKEGAQFNDFLKDTVVSQEISPEEEEIFFESTDAEAEEILGAERVKEIQDTVESLVEEFVEMRKQEGASVKSLPFVLDTFTGKACSVFEA